MQRAKILAGSFFLAGWLSFAHAQSPMREQIRTRALEMNADLREAKYDKLLDLTYPKFTEMNGGRDAMMTALKSTMEQIAKAGFKFDSVDLGQASEPVAAGDKMFAVVPETVHMTGPKVKVEQAAYLLAISTDKGKTWTFLDGSGITPEILKQFFPEFPATLKLPDKQQPTVTPIS